MLLLVWLDLVPSSDRLTTFERRQLRKKNVGYDVVVVSMGGTGCSNLIAQLGKLVGAHGKKLTLNNVFNEDRIKHAYPAALRNVHFNIGVIYVTGNLTLAIKSLIRRHFIATQIKILGGNTTWLSEQRYTWNDSSIPLFRPAPRWEKEEDAKTGSTIPSILRMQHILEYAGITQEDPIGMFKHFKAWRDFASGSERNFPIIFVNLNKMTTDTSLTILTSFLNVTNLGTVDLRYKPKKRKQGDILEAVLGSSVDVEYREKIVSGFQFYDKITRSEIDSFHARLFAS